MEEALRKKLQATELGERQQFRNVSVFPLFSKAKPPARHLVLREAMANGLITVSEISESGHVPELKVVNNADTPVLILDGEELFGAKQNRVLNTTVLLKMKSVTIIPVSCTEQGRWTYRSETFSESGIIMSPNVRRVKNRSVQESLRSCNEFRSDQGAVWGGIHEQAAAMSVESPTYAMRDVHERVKDDVGSHMEHFPCLDGQCGLLVVIGGSVAGLDLVSYAPAYKLLHEKLVRSYVMDALLKGTGKTSEADKATARAFLDDMGECEGSEYESVGHGRDVRFEGRGMFGSALIYRGGMVHLAMFPGNEKVQQDDSDMQGYQRRANHRRRPLH